MTAGDVHTVHRDGKWLNTIEGGDDAGGTHATKEEAVAAGRDLARSRKAEHLIHNLDGKIGERQSYGNDPTSSPG